jgi:hypothetical protein
MSLTTGGIYLFLGRSGCGKSHMLSYVAYQMKQKFDVTFGFCPTAFAGNLSFVPEERRFEQFDPRKVELILQYQANCLRDTGKCGEVLLIFDDCLGESSMKLYGNLFLALATKCRHYHVTVFITAQYLKKVPPALRENCKYVFICSASRPDEMSMMYKEFAIGGDKKNFITMLENYTNGFNVLLIDLEKKNPKDVYKKLQAEAKIPHFKI